MAETTTYRTPKRRLFAVPVPEETRTYKPVSYKELAKTTIESIRDAGFELDKEYYYSLQDGQVATGRYTIRDISDEDMQLEIAWQNSYNKRVTVKFAIGTRIFVCDNGCVSGDFGSFARRHISDVQDYAPEEIRRAILDARTVFDSMKAEKDEMKRAYIGKTRQYELLGKLFGVNKNISTRDVGKIKEEIDNPTHHYGAPETIWELYQYVTYVIKHIHPTLWMDTHIEIHNFFVEESRLHFEYGMKLDDHTQWRRLVNTAGERGINENQLISMITSEVEHESEQPIDLEKLESRPQVKNPAQIDLLDSIAEIESLSKEEE